jgi:asparagine synthase (glutamine-hydrolysing)
VTAAFSRSPLSDTAERARSAAWYICLENQNRQPSEGSSLREGSAALLFDGAGKTLQLVRCGRNADVGTVTSEDGAVSIIMEGVLYNGRALRQLLGLRPDASPLQTVLAGYREWGDRVAQRLEGIYALVIWDGRASRMLCVRDRLGVYPLYIARGNGTVVVGPDIEPVRSHPSVRAPFNRVALAVYLAHEWPLPDETYYEGVRRVIPGNILHVSDTAERVERYWNPTPEDGPIRWLKNEQLGGFDELLDEAVAEPMSLGPIGIFLSGGLDSISVAAVAAERARKTGDELPLALALVFEHDSCNEEEIQRGVARELGLPLVIKPLHDAIGPLGLVRAGLDATAHFPFPIINLWAPAYHDLARIAAERGRNVIIGGGGGDEWLTVTPQLAADLISRFQFVELFRLWRTVNRSWPLKPHHTLINVLWINGLRSVLMAAADEFAPGLRPALHRRHMSRRIPEWIAPDPELRKEVTDRFIATAPKYRFGDFYRRTGRVGVEHSLVSMEMEEQFVMWRHFGVRVLQPYWNPKLIEFMIKVPPSMLNQDGRSKGLVRAALARRFPGLGFEKQKKVLGKDFAREWMRSEVADVWRGAGGAPLLAELGIIEPRELHQTAEHIISSHALRDSFTIWDVLKMESWVRTGTNHSGETRRWTKK